MCAIPTLGCSLQHADKQQNIEPGLLWQYICQWSHHALSPAFWQENICKNRDVLTCPDSTAGVNAPCLLLYSGVQPFTPLPSSHDPRTASFVFSCLGVCDESLPVGSWLSGCAVGGGPAFTDSAVASAGPERLAKIGSGGASRSTESSGWVDGEAAFSAPCVFQACPCHGWMQMAKHVQRLSPGSAMQLMALLS